VNVGIVTIIITPHSNPFRDSLRSSQDNELTSHRSGCSLCPAGTYNGNSGSTSANDCTPCPVDTYSSQTGRTQVSDCAACSGGGSTYSTTGAKTCWQEYTAVSTNSDLLGLIHQDDSSTGTALSGSTVKVAAETYDGASNNGINIQIKKEFY